MNDLDEIYEFLKTRKFDGFQFGNGKNGKPFKTVINSKEFLEKHYDVAKNSKIERARIEHYNDLKQIYNNFKLAKV